MAYLFSRHHVMPWELVGRSQGEMDLALALASHEIEMREEAREE